MWKTRSRLEPLPRCRLLLLLPLTMLGSHPNLRRASSKPPSPKSALLEVVFRLAAQHSPVEPRWHAFLFGATQLLVWWASLVVDGQLPGVRSLDRIQRHHSSCVGQLFHLPQASPAACYRYSNPAPNTPQVPNYCTCQALMAPSPTTGAQAQHSGQEMWVLTANLERPDYEAQKLTLGCTLEPPGSHPERGSAYGLGCGQVPKLQDDSNVQSPLRAPCVRAAAFSAPTL